MFCEAIPPGVAFFWPQSGRNALFCGSMEQLTRHRWLAALARPGGYGYLLLLLTVGNGFLLARLLGLAALVPPMTDDFWLLAKLNDHGIWGTSQFFYLSWGGRLGSYLATALCLRGYQLWGTLFPYYFLLTIGLLYFAYQHLSALLARLGARLPYQRLALANCAALLLGVLLLVVPERGTFFWLCASIIYFGSVLAALAASHWLLADQARPWAYWLPIFGASWYAANASETFGTLWLVGLVGYGAWQFGRRGTRPSWARAGKCTAALAGAATGWAVLVLAPGNALRQRHFANGGLAQLPGNLRRNLPYFVMEQLPHLLLPLGFGALVLFYLGTRAQRSPSVPPPDLARELLVGLVVVAGLGLCALGPPIYATGGVGPGRSMIGIALLLVGAVAYLAFQLGQWSVLPRRVALGLALLAGLAYTYKQRFDQVNHLAGAQRFAREYRARLAHLRQLQAAGQRDTVTLRRVNLPPGVFPFLELSPRAAENELFRQAYGLAFPMRVEQ
jgi:Family of unknown function (DUF6056)